MGNVLEWYDFAAYAYMAPILGKLFFPSDDQFSSLIAAFGAFAAGYVSRPVGAVIFGHVGDKLGRRKMLVISVAMMGVATTAIGVLPVESQIGWAAAALLVVLRVFQGLSVGGEYGGALTFMAEHAPPRRRALFTSMVSCGASAGFLVGAGVAAAVTALVGQTAMESWAWRLPFLVGGCVAVLAVVMRRGLAEPPLPEGYKPLEGMPLVVAVRDHWRSILRVGGLYLAVNAGFYLIFVYVISYLTDIMGMTLQAAMDINLVCVFIMSVLPLAFAFLGEKIGHRSMLIMGMVALIALTYPLFLLLHHAAVVPVLLGQLGFALVFSWIFAVNPAAQAEAVPRHVRATVLTLASNVSMAVFGGTMPMVAAYLVERTHDDFSPAYYLMALGVISLIAVLTTREMAGKPLP